MRIESIKRLSNSYVVSKCYSSCFPFIAYLQSQVGFQCTCNLVFINEYLNHELIIKVPNEILASIVLSVLIGRHVGGEISHREKEL